MRKEPHTSGQTQQHTSTDRRNIPSRDSSTQSRTSRDSGISLNDRPNTDDDLFYSSRTTSVTLPEHLFERASDNESDDEPTFVGDFFVDTTANSPTTTVSPIDSGETPKTSSRASTESSIGSVFRNFFSSPEVKENVIQDQPRSISVTSTKVSFGSLENDFQANQCDVMSAPSPELQGVISKADPRPSRRYL